MRGLAFVLVALAACESPAAPHAEPRSPLSVLGGQLDARRWLDSTAALARAAGAGELQPIAAAVLSEGDQIGTFVELEPDQCLLTLARSGPSVRDVDVFVYSDGGERLGADEAPESNAAVMVCPPHPRRMYVAARVVVGSGMLALGALPVARDRAEAVGRAVAARGLPGQDTGRLAAWPGLESKIRQRRAELGSSWQDVRRLALPLDPHAYSTVTVPVQAGRCLDVLVTPGDEIAGLQLLAVDEAGRVVGRGRPPGRDRTLILCSEVQQDITVLVRPRLASGMAAVVVSTSPPGAASELAERTWVDAVTPIAPLEASRERHHERMKSSRYDKQKTVGTHPLSPGAIATVPLTLEAGCSRVDVIGGAPLGRFTTELWSDDGKRLASGRGGELATLITCGAAGKARLELDALERGGPVSVEIRRDPKPPQVLLDQPIAAGRLLARLETTEGPIDANDAAAAIALSLATDARHSQPVEVPAGECREAIAALATGRGVGLTLAAADDRRHSRGEHVVSARLCAADQPLAAELELSVSSGPADVLLLVRPITRE